MPRLSKYTKFSAQRIFVLEKLLLVGYQLNFFYSIVCIPMTCAQRENFLKYKFMHDKNFKLKFEILKPSLLNSLSSPVDPEGETL